MRAFIGIKLDDAIDDISLIIENLKIKDRFANYTLLNNVHITLEFLGEIQESMVSKIEDIFSNINNDSFNLEIKSLTNLRDLVILDVFENEELIDLQRDLRKSLKEVGITVQDRKYYPHITLARKASIKVYLNYNKVVKVREIILFSSKKINGVLTYTPVLIKKLG